MKYFHTFRLSDGILIMLINVKMQTIAGILTFMNMVNLILSWDDHEKLL